MSQDFLDFLVYPVLAGILIAFLLALLKLAFGGGGNMHGQTVSRLLEIIEKNQSDIDRLDRKVETQGRKQRNQEREIRQLRLSNTNWHAFYQDLVARWDIHRSNARPPAAPKESDDDD